MRMETIGSLMLFAGSILFFVNVARSGCKVLCCGEGGLLGCLQDSSDEPQEDLSESVVKKPAREVKKASKKVAAKKKVVATKKKQAKKAAKK